MLVRLLTTPVKWVLALSLLGGLVFGLFLLKQQMQAESAAGEGAPPRSKESLVKLEEDEAERYGLKTERARAVHWYPHVTVYGRVVPNPQATAEVRSPFAGKLQPAAGTPWSALGQRVRAGQTLGWVDVRVGPEILVDLKNKLAEARIRQQGAEVQIKLQQKRVNSLKKVTSQGIFSHAELEAAEIQLAQFQNQLATARASAELWHNALQEVELRKGKERSPWSHRLVAPADGEITAVPGRPGMAVEPGALVFEIVNFRHPLIRLDIPPEILTLGGPPKEQPVQVAAVPPAFKSVLNPSPSARPSPAVTTHLAGPAPRVDVTSQFVSYWYEAHLPAKDKASLSALWRPGMQVVAEVQARGAAPQAAIAVPARAVLYHQGRPLVFVRVGSEEYQRREVHLLSRMGDTWVLAARQGGLPVGVTADEAVVTHAAQVLLSKEFLGGAADND